MEVITRRFSFFSEVDNLEIDCMSIEPEGEIKGIVQLVHGMCEYKERYVDFMTYLAKKGYVCVIHDHRGHGKSVTSDKDLGYFYKGGWEALIEDTHQLTLMIKSEIKNSSNYSKRDIPFILLGHSMGSMVVRCYVKKYDADIDKLVVVGCPSKLPGTGPGLMFVKVVKKIIGEKKHSKILDELVINSQYEKRFKDEGVHAWVNSNKDRVAEYNADPFCNFTFTVNGYENLVMLTRETYNKKGWKVENPDLPIYFFSGKDDPCAISPKDFGKAVHFMKEVGYKNVKGGLYKGMRHEILNEDGKNRVYKDIYSFISKES